MRPLYRWPAPATPPAGWWQVGSRKRYKKSTATVREIMRKQQAKVVRKSPQRTPSAKTIDVRSPLARRMLKLVVQFDQTYDQLKAQWHEPGGIDEQEGLELMENARQAVQEFSRFLEGFKEQARRGGSLAPGASMR